MPKISVAGLHPNVVVTLDVSVTQTKQLSTHTGRVFGVLVVTAPTGAISFYDGTSTSGTLIGVVPTTAAAGTFVTFMDGGMPYNTGLYASGATTTGKVNVAIAEHVVNA